MYCVTQWDSCSKENQRVDQTDIDGLVQKRRNSSALAMELRLSYTNLLIYDFTYLKDV